MNGIDNMATQLATITTDPPKPSEAKATAIAAKAVETILAQAGSMAKVSLSALEVCRKIGEAATKAKAALAHREFTPWLETNFGPESKAPFTVQWIRVCMRVHEAFVRLESHKDREKILAQFGNDVKKFASLLAMMESGQNPLTFQPEKRAAKAGTQATQSAPESDNAASAKVLQRKLDAAEKKIADLTAKLAKANETIVAQKLEIATLKDAAKEARKRSKADVTDVEAKTKAKAKAKAKALPAPSDTLEGARAMQKKGAAVAKAKADKAKGIAPKAKAKAKPKADAPALIDIDTSDVPADLLANASSTLDTGMGASA